MLANTLLVKARDYRGGNWFFGLRGSKALALS